MNITISVSEDVVQHLDKLELDNTNTIEEKLARLLEAEYRRRLARYSLTDRQLVQKYNMNFAQFEQERITEQRNYAWDVESDAIAWETAFDGIHTIQKKLSELLHANN